jgi:drug/metabolite transporter (DMT)-like permease
MTISEGYIIVAAMLGYFVGKEKLKSHQLLGAAIALPAVILLAYMSN